MRALRFATLAVVLVALASCPLAARAEGPWRGQVIDKDTQQPVPGAVVVGIWTRLSPGMVHPVTEFDDVAETVTDDRGRFVIPARSMTTTRPLTRILGPRLVIFKAGYGRWQFRGLELLATADAYVVREATEKAWKSLEEEGAVIELPRLKTVQERMDWTGQVRPSYVPDERIPLFFEALDAESVALGLGSVRVPKGNLRP
jgi:hypothetical protein